MPIMLLIIIFNYAQKNTFLHTDKIFHFLLYWSVRETEYNLVEMITACG